MANSLKDVKLTKVILLTGYEPWDKFPYNPSGVIAQALDGREVGQGYVIRGAVMPVDCVAMPEALAKLWEQYRPAYVVGLGLAFGDSGLRLERLGHNWVAIYTPDNGGHTRPGEPIIEGAPAAYFSPLPVASMVAALLEEGIPAYPSDHAGTHLCNEMLYVSLHRASAMQQNRPHCGFIHLPATPELAVQVALSEPRGKPGPSMSLDLMQRGVELALNYIVKNQ